MPVGSRNDDQCLPPLGAAYYEGYDDTEHLYFTAREQAEPVCTLARGLGLYVLDED